MVTYIKSDLEFILEQIKIAEAHAAGQPLFGPGGLVPTYNLAWGLRTVDGSYNHLLPGQEQWGASGVPFPELVPAAFRPADGTMFDPDGPGGPAPEMPTQPNYNPSNDPNSLVFDSSLRTISNLLVDQTLGNPAAILTALERAGATNAMLDLPAVTAIYMAFKPASDAEYQARVVMQNAKTAADNAGDGDPLTPPDVIEQAALDALALATAAHAATVTALDAARDVRTTALEPYGIAMDGDNVHLPAIAPDEGLSAPFNSWFTLFGQFFDHGLDLVNKGGSGTVFVPLQPDDPLYVEGSHTNFMVLTRATVSPGPDNVFGTADDVRPVNTTTAYVDQNQTYTSHASHQVFLRQYVLDGSGHPVATGKLIEGANGGMATWGEVKLQARELLGINLTDSDVGSVPLLRTDAYGNFIPGPGGFPQIILGVGGDGIPNTSDDLVLEGNPTILDGLGAPLGVETAGAIRTNSAFLADIAHEAVPVGKIADGDITIGLENPGNGDTEYDNELLDAHFIAGDGRANENIGLTAVHHVFHAEHNRLVEHTKDTVLATNDLAFINEWLAGDIADLAAIDTQGERDALKADIARWDGERLFQAAKFGTEMQYQHLVFEEFARKIQPNINVFLVPDGFDTTINPDIVAEFAHVVYRFGHSMLTESIDRYDADFNADHIGLIQGFLNPLAYDGAGTPVAHTITDEVAAGAIIRGMTRQVGNEIDEFVTTALRNNLLGLPLDLATINLARGRDTGVPTLNQARRDFYQATNNEELLKPYSSWVDFAGHLKHEASIINFIAAYGTHSLITGAVTLQEKRDAALTIITGVSTGGFAVPADRLAFLNATGPTWSGGTLGGLENVDLWIGGLAEEIMPFGGMLGSTFNFVFEVQMEALQNGDRFYYLQRLDGLHLFGEMEANSFAGLIMRNTDATHLPSDVFSTPGLILEVDQTRQFNLGIHNPGPDGILLDDLGTPGDESADNIANNGDPVGGGLLTPLVLRDDPATEAVETNYLRYTGDDHVLLGGTDDADTLIGSIGDDTLFGDGGNDRLEGGFGNDIINGGAGDDIIRDMGGDDNIKGGDGDDAIHAGNGLDLVLGGAGQDFVVLGTDMGSEIFGGEGDDFMFGNKNAERILGNEGNDWIETGTFDGAPGDNFDEIFARDGIDGHDVFLGDGGFDEFIGEGGDDIFVGSLGRGKMAGQSGFDWATYKDMGARVDADLSIPIVFDEAPVLPPNTALDEFESVQGLSGTRFNDKLTGSDEDVDTLRPLAQGGSTGYLGSGLDAQGIAMIAGLQAVVGAGVTEFARGDIILGGDGNDVIQGKAGDDIIDGDKWLDVQIGVFAPGDTNHTGTPLRLVNSMKDLTNDVFAGLINPGQLAIVRSIKTADGTGDVDTAVFADVRAAYTITNNPDGSITVAHTNVSDGLESDGADNLRNIELMQFADMTIAVNQPATGAPVIGDLTPTEGEQLLVDTSAIADANGLGSFSYQWQSSPNGVTWTNIAGATGSAFTPQNLGGQNFGAQAGLQLRVTVSFTDGGGNVETVLSGPTGPTGVDWSGTGGGNTLNGTAGDDIAAGNGGNDTLNGNGGADMLAGGTGNDTVNGGAGDDLLDGNAGNDSLLGGDDNDTLNGGTGTDTLQGGLGADIMNGGADSDTLSGGGGNDTIIQISNAGGRDFVDGGADIDTYQLNGVPGGEIFRIYTRAAWDAIAGNNGASLNANTEIVITRGGTNLAAVIAELDNIEEIAVNTLNVTTPGGSGGGSNGGDQIFVIGNFVGTSLDFNTITIEGTAGDDVIDISSLASAHRIVFRSNGGNDTIVGTVRSQDVFELPAGDEASETTDDDGFTILSDGTNSIRYRGDGGPGNDDDDDDDDDDEDDDHDDDDDDNDDDHHHDDDDDDNPAPAPSGHVIGTPQDDILLGSSAGDLVFGFAGTDYIVTHAGVDVIRAGADNDFADAGADRDIIFGDDGDDDLFGGDDDDMIYGGNGDDRIFGQDGNDLLDGGDSDDQVFGGNGNDLIVASLNDGNDTYYGGDISGDTGIDTLDMGFLSVAAAVDLGTGVGGRGSAVSSQSGTDSLWGVDNVTTGSGNDTITMSNAVNIVDGGQGEDVFIFGSAAAAHGDTIRGFEAGDKIDLSGIDANAGTAGNDVFTLESGQTTTAPGQLAVTHETRADGEYTVISGDTAGNNAPEFRISIAGNHALTINDFSL